MSGSAPSLTEIGRSSGAADRDGPEDWISATDELDGDLDQAWAILQQARESGRMNPRPAVADRMRATEGLPSVLGQLSQAAAETRSMARTIGLARSHRTGGPRSSAGLSPISGSSGRGRR